ncbi:MAG TPA: DUF1786 family protein [Anaerolineales bacterium]|nr:DUF1786 family protein [Anaerolineales bacterium]
MKILTVDVGTGTQDIYLYDSRVDLENGFKLVAPSPTMQIYRRLAAATRRGQAVMLSGVTMGGGPSQWAAEAHLRAGLPVYATPDAARSFNDDLDAVARMGIKVLGEDEAQRLPASVLRLELRDFDFAAIRQAFASVDVSLDKLDAVAVAVFDHGNAPPEVSDRQFRFDYLDARIHSLNRLSAFAYRAGDVPAAMTRLQAVVKSAQGLDAPLVVMDTAPAAILGAAFDRQVMARERVMVANVGNFHTLAFRLGPGEPWSRSVDAVFEHHTGLVDADKLETLLYKLADGSLRHETVFEDHGHGALVYASTPLAFGQGDFDVVAVGPRRSLLSQAKGLRTYFPAPFGDMMLAGCFGLLAATAHLLPSLAEEVRSSLLGRVGAAPWEIEA